MGAILDPPVRYVKLNYRKYFFPIHSFARDILKLIKVSLVFWISNFFLRLFKAQNLLVPSLTEKMALPHTVRFEHFGSLSQQYCNRVMIRYQQFFSCICKKSVLNTIRPKKSYVKRLVLEIQLENLNPLRPFQDLPGFQEKTKLKLKHYLLLQQILA